MTTTGTRGADAGTAESAAVARWAAAAGVPESVAQGYESRTSTTTRFLRGVLLGGVVAVPVLLLGAIDGPGGGLWPVVVLVLAVIGLRIAQQRRHRRRRR
ncbi:hypothetical protein GCU60_08105 [Blastococcus saxobsidens]|uniref:Uncharacterized protein n=1 Tax=Blastococcus saxobsidens TaxID=138336 RepID=A0A6L9W2Q5_9ACTN|nr:hypothetical protein [Blastococcus saxobsidens]NEK85724.1 hypothetical protein [Blastococcus saxobsidens]